MKYTVYHFVSWIMRPFEVSLVSLQVEGFGKDVSFIVYIYIYVCTSSLIIMWFYIFIAMKDRPCGLMSNCF